MVKKKKILWQLDVHLKLRGCNCIWFGSELFAHLDACYLILMDIPKTTHFGTFMVESGFLRYSNFQFFIHFHFIPSLFLQVSDVSVHPNFRSTPDSDVAVLKLTDKAKISERVLPVCLPKVQGGEVTAQEAYTARWILPNDYRRLSHYTPSSQTKLVELGDVSQCEREFAQGGARTTMISDNTLCVIRKLTSLQSSCPSFVPGITAVPAVFSSTSGVLPGHEEAPEASITGWQLLGLERFSSEENNCHQQTHTVQTRIGNFRDWIEKNMK